jgi:hypothetical protein
MLRQHLRQRAIGLGIAAFVFVVRVFAIFMAPEPDAQELTHRLLEPVITPVEFIESQKKMQEMLDRWAAEKEIKVDESALREIKLPRASHSVAANWYQPEPLWKTYLKKYMSGSTLVDNGPANAPVDADGAAQPEHDSDNGVASPAPGAKGQARAGGAAGTVASSRVRYMEGDR